MHQRATSTQGAALAGLALGALLLSEARADEPYRMNRGQVRVRPFYGIKEIAFDGELHQPPAGALADLSIEAETRSGFRIGFDLAPLMFLAPRPQITARLHLGYANELLAISMGLGSGLTWLYPQAGPVIRIGRHEGAHAHFRLSFSLYPPRPLPVDADLDVLVPVHPRLRLQLNVGGGYGNLIGVYGTVGTQVLLARQGVRGATRLSVGVGVAWVQYYLGPTGLAGLEQLF